MAVNENLKASLQTREYEEISRAVVDAAGGGRTLDWGCGYGQVSKLMSDRGGNVTSCEYDAFVDGVETRPLATFPDLDVDLTSEPVKLPYDDASFDAVLSCGVLEHVHAPLESLAELRRVLRPGGSLFVYKLPNRYSVLELVAKVGGLPYHGMRIHDTLWGLRSAEAALTTTGFEVDWVRRSNFLPLTLDHPAVNKRASGLWKLNGRLAGTRGLNLLATNIDARARRPLSDARPPR